MKYARLTKEQFNSLEQEFINFLAAQSITAEEWQKIKTETPEIAEDELDIFSDLVWEGVLSKTAFLENNGAHELFLFKTGETEMELIAVKCADATKDFTTAEGFNWLKNNLALEEISVYTAKKAYSKERNVELFSLIQQGASITKGELFRAFKEILQ